MTINIGHRLAVSNRVIGLKRWGKRTVKSRLFSRVIIDPVTGCWNWTGSDDTYGYGKLSIGGRYFKTHTVMWWIYEGVVPAGLTLDHLCRNTLCCRPEHLEPVEPGENTRRQLAINGHPNANKTACPQGHLFDEANTRYASRGYGRVCRTCRAESSRIYRIKLKAMA